jgi:hypothetical protein
MTIDKQDNNWFTRKDDMLDIFCPHCDELHQICFSTFPNENHYLNPELGVKDAITGFTDCSHCEETIWFDYYPPYTKNPYGTLLEVYKINRCE